MTMFDNQPILTKQNLNQFMRWVLLNHPKILGEWIQYETALRIMDRKTRK